MVKRKIQNKSFLDKYRNILVCLFLIISTLFVYWQVSKYDFVAFDDDVHVYENLDLQRGITFENIKWAFTTTSPDFWHPVTWLTHMLGYELYGLNPGKHHLINLFIHIVNTLLLFLFFYRSTRSTWRSAFVAALFALHPLHVESVAWITERKDVLSAFFMFVTLLIYTSYAKKPDIFKYLLVLFTYSLGLMSKALIVTLPFLLILLDYWPLGRLDFGQSKDTEKLNIKKVSPGRLLLEKVPLLVLSAIVMGIIFSQKDGAPFIPLETAPVSLRISNALVSYVTYIIKMIWPGGLAVLYPYPDSLPLWQVAGSLILLLMISIQAFRWRLSHPYLVTGWFWYMGTFVPVIGLVQFGLWAAISDRHTYVPLTGIFIMLAWGIPQIFGKGNLKKDIIRSSSFIVLILLMICTKLQVSHWRNSITLFKHTLEVTSNNYVIHNNYGRAILFQDGREDEAMSHFKKALVINPRSEYAHSNIGILLAREGKLEEAITQFSKALSIQPDDDQTQFNLGLALSQQGKTDEAIEHYEEALRINPSNIKVLNNLGMTLQSQGRIDEAIKHYEEALKINPKDENAHNNLGLVLQSQGLIEEAVKHYREALGINPGNEKVHNNLAVALTYGGYFTEAVKHFREALKINPNYTEAKNNLNEVLIYLKNENN